MTHDNDNLLPRDDWQTPTRGTLEQEYDVYRACADDGKGGDITRPGKPLKTFQEWLES